MGIIGKINRINYPEKGDVIEFFDDPERRYIVLSTTMDDDLRIFIEFMAVNDKAIDGGKTLRSEVNNMCCKIVESNAYEVKQIWKVKRKENRNETFNQTAKES